MKNIHITIAILTVFLLGAGCTKQLNQSPNDQLSTQNFFKNSNDALLALNGCYGYLDGDQTIIYNDAMSDNAYAQYPWESNATDVAAGNITVNLDQGYGNRYIGIRRFNYFLANVDKVTMDPALKKRYTAEVKFLRAFSYFNLTTIFGPVPLIVTDLSDPEAAKIAPAPQADVIKFVMKELADAAPDLPASYAGGLGNEFGRVTKGATLALRARAGLYFQDYASAAADAKSVMGMNYKLFTVEPSSTDLSVDYSNLVDFQDAQDKARFYKGLASYTEQYWSANEQNSEIILTSQYAENINPTRITTWLFPAIYNGWSSVTPTQELVNAYGDRKGNVATNLPTPQQRAANYNNGAYTAQFLSEFKNRDTRLYASILFPGNKIYINNSVSTFAWGKGGNNNSKTGYNFRKLADPNHIQEQNGDNNAPLIRFAEVLLTFAEAQNELAGPSTDVYNAIDQLHERVGMADVDRTLYASKESLRKLILNERRIELAGEGQRFWDIRRLNVASAVMHDVRDISNELAQARVWQDKFKLFPYPTTATDRNPNLAAAQSAKGY
jgi:hypothetical protein